MESSLIRHMWRRGSYSRNETVHILQLHEINIPILRTGWKHRVQYFVPISTNCTVMRGNPLTQKYRNSGRERGNATQNTCELYQITSSTTTETHPPDGSHTWNRTVYRRNLHTLHTGQHIYRAFVFRASQHHWHFMLYCTSVVVSIKTILSQKYIIPARNHRSFSTSLSDPQT